MTQSDQFDPAAIRQSASIATLKFLPQCESTNDSAIAWIREEVVATPALVLTANQTRGRGQQDRTWVSAPGNLAATWIFSGPTGALDRGEWGGKISIGTSLAVCETIARYLGDASHLLQVKWPNDIFIGNQKVSGILIETKPGANCPYAIVGIGINVNAAVAPVDQNLAVSAIFIRQHAATDIDLTELVILLSTNLVRRIDSIARANSDWSSEYNSRLMGMNRPVVVKSAGSETRGVCRGIDGNGGLKVETSDGIQIVKSGSLFLET